MKRTFLKIAIFAVILVNIAMISIFIFQGLLDFTGSNSTLYFVRTPLGGIEVKRDLFLEEADRLIFMFNLNSVFNRFMKGQATAKNKSMLELTWDEDMGVGGVKQFRPDGTMLSLCFSRYDLKGTRSHGLFMGGNLPYGDTVRGNAAETGGLGYFDGKQWQHIWCTANEIFWLQNANWKGLYNNWEYLGSRVLKDDTTEVILESDHRIRRDGYAIDMRRLVSFRAEDDYYTLKVTFTNAGNNFVTYSYSWGDEPWVGSYWSGSKGDVGWYEKELVKYERFITPTLYSYAGFWDYGNDAAGELHDFSGYANFVEWQSPVPSYVYFSNALNECCDETAALSSKMNRVLNVVWNRITLFPGESQTHTLTIGMAKPDPVTGRPRKPLTAAR